MVRARHLLVLSLLAAGASASLHPTPAPGHRMQKRLVPGLLPPGPSEDTAASDSAASAASASAASASQASAASASSASAAAAASQSAASASSVSAAAASSQSVQDAIKSVSRAAASSAAAAASSSQAAASASAASSSAAAASSSAAAVAASQAASTVFSTSIVSAPSTSSTAEANNNSGSSNKTPLIIGVSVVGGIAVLALIIFLYVKFGQKRFSDYDDDDADIKWPELKTDPDSAAMVALPARRTGGAGVDMGDEVSEHGGDTHSMQEYGAKQRDSFTASNVALTSNGSYGQHGVTPGPTVYEDQAGYGMPGQGYYDPYGGYGAQAGQGYYPTAAAGGSHYSAGVYADQAGAAGYVDPSQHAAYVDPAQAAAAHQGQEYAAYHQDMGAAAAPQYPKDPYARGPSPPQAAAGQQGYGAQPLHNPYA